MITDNHIWCYKISQQCRMSQTQWCPLSYIMALDAFFSFAKKWKTESGRRIFTKIIKSSLIARLNHLCERISNLWNSASYIRNDIERNMLEVHQGNANRESINIYKRKKTYGCVTAQLHLLNAKRSHEECFNYRN